MIMIYQEYMIFIKISQNKKAPQKVPGALLQLARAAQLDLI